MILGVGGFLGIGEKDVAVNTNAVQMVQDGDNTRLVVQATKEALESAPSYDRTNRRYATDTNAARTTTTPRAPPRHPPRAPTRHGRLHAAGKRQQRGLRQQQTQQ